MKDEDIVKEMNKIADKHNVNLNEYKSRYFLSHLISKSETFIHVKYLALKRRKMRSAKRMKSN